MFTKLFARLGLATLVLPVLTTLAAAQEATEPVPLPKSPSDRMSRSAAKDPGYELRLWRAQYKAINRTMELEYYRMIGFDPARPIVAPTSLFSAPARPRYYISAPIGPSLYFGPSIQNF